MEIKDKDLEGVNGGFDIGFDESDYDVVYKKDNEWEPDEPIKPGTYTVGITANTLSMKQKILPNEIDIEELERYRQSN